MTYLEAYRYVWISSSAFVVQSIVGTIDTLDVSLDGALLITRRTKIMTKTSPRTERRAGTKLDQSASAMLWLRHTRRFPAKRLQSLQQQSPKDSWRGSEEGKSSFSGSYSRSIVHQLRNPPMRIS